IEGVAGITHFDETLKDKDDYKWFQGQMTREVVAACEGALLAGATEILIKDAYDTGRNLHLEQLPEMAKVLRGWGGSPLFMVQGLEKDFAAVLMVGYHSGAGGAGNPLAHTMSSQSISWMSVNGTNASEFLLHAHAAAELGVPVAFVSGDEGLCEEVGAVNPAIQTVAVSEGVGDSTISIHPDVAVRRIREGVERVLGGDLAACQLAVPERYEVELRFVKHTQAYKASHYPRVEQIDAHTIRFAADRFHHVLTMMMFTLGF
ncbi:MAG: M55 family metallopeptidase, partial [Deltaproteobacteria bacterium]|nr:M55 family metallopeptidase [Deltaproteobacteria bacterium]